MHNFWDHPVFVRTLQVGMVEGVQTAMDEKQVKDAVDWMRRVWSSHDRPPKKITQADRKHLLVYSRSANLRH